jgi:two-component system chemotaxis sensor kinase CheA
VGLDIVKTSVEALGGTVQISTQKGKGTRFTLELPLTTALMYTLMVGVGEHIFAIPSNIILESIIVAPKDIREIRNDKVLILREEVIPFFELNEVLNISRRKERENLIALIIQRADKFIALGVDELIDQMENIVKPFDPIARQFKGFSGGTILGDGNVALLLDIPGLFVDKNYDTAKWKKSENLELESL